MFRGETQVKLGKRGRLSIIENTRLRQASLEEGLEVELEIKEGSSFE